MIHTVRYVLMDPTANRTILVETPVPVEVQPDAATALMALEPTAEQVGFLFESPAADIALRMAGGEFCANATMSAAVFCAMRRAMRAGSVTVSVSGAAEPVAVEIETEPDGLWRGTVHMPRPLSVKNVRFSDGQMCPVVSFDGIAHVIAEGAPTEYAEDLARRRCAELSADALGLMFWERDAGRVTPLVYVPRADTLFWENSCGSGTAAVGAYLAKQTGQSVCLSLRQPGGVLEIVASPDGTLRLRGSVRCVSQNTAVLEW